MSRLLICYGMPNAVANTSHWDCSYFSQNYNWNQWRKCQDCKYTTATFHFAFHERSERVETVKNNKMFYWRWTKLEIWRNKGRYCWLLQHTIKLLWSLLDHTLIFSYGTPVKKITPETTTPKPVPGVTSSTKPPQVKSKDSFQVRSQTTRSGRFTQVPSKFKTLKV